MDVDNYSLITHLGSVCGCFFGSSIGNLNAGEASMAY
jgi:hypothetical protein